MPMSKELRLQWAAALRSGEYIQGYNGLCSITENGSRAYCCLGVLANLIDALEPEFYTNRMKLKRSLSPSPCDSCLVLSDKLLAKLGLSVYAQSELVDANDKRKCTFDQIADAIEAGAICGVEI